MIICPGKSVFEGIAIGKACLYAAQEVVPEKRRVQDPATEIARFETAKRQTHDQMGRLYEKVCRESGKEQAQIFAVHQLMLEDSNFLEPVRSMIRREQTNAEYAVYQTGENLYALFASMEDAYMSARREDIRDISGMLIQALTGNAVRWHSPGEPVILLAESLSPSEAVQLERDAVLAFVLRDGSAYSHTAILARSWGIPALVQTQLELKSEYNGLCAVVDGIKGELLLDPDAETLQRMQREKEEDEKERAALFSFVGQKSVTAEGRQIRICANINSARELETVLENDAEGIGLMRSEYLYLERNSCPSEEEQFQQYKKVISGMNGKEVVIRTLDIGADKRVGYLNQPAEENPAMGYRGIRLCLDQKELFKEQLRAILRAAAYGNAAVLLPMIVSCREVLETKALLEEIRMRLMREKIPFGEVKLGAMIETPAAVMISDRLAQEVDFFSIGTNDLIQYTLAADRQNSYLEGFYDPYHPSVLRMIRMTVENGHRAGIPVAICGELAADASLTQAFVEMGVDELSVAPAQVLKLRRAVRCL